MSMNQALVVLLLLLFSPLAAAQAPEETSDVVIFSRGQALWSIEASGGKQTELVKLPWPAKEVTQLKVASYGSALLVRNKNTTGWLSLREPKAKLRLLPCSGHSNISADGDQIVCSTQDGQKIAIYRLRPSLGVEIISHKSETPLFFAVDADPTEVIAYGDKQDLVALQSKGSRVASSHRPTSSLRVAPNGKRAIGDYDEGKIAVVYTFRLDGRATKRTLVHAARAVGISANSKWAAIQQEVDACAVRLAGGQYMCWRRFEALSISSGGRSLLVSRANGTAHDLYLGAVRGTSSRKPTLLLSGVAPVAVFARKASPRN